MEQFKGQEFDLHEPNCKFKIVDCEICKHKFTLGELDNHIRLCKSKTLKCEKCLTVYSLTDQAAHMKDCDQIWKNLKICEKCGSKVPENKWYKHGERLYCYDCFNDREDLYGYLGQETNQTKSQCPKCQKEIQNEFLDIHT